MENKEKTKIIFSVLAVLLSGLLHYIHFNAIVTFVVLATALSLLAMIVGEATEQLGERMGPSSAGILQSALGNLPELFVCIFALRAGMTTLVQAALIGSILGNSLLVLGLALFLGGLKNGTQIFKSEPPQMIATLMMIAFAALVIPTLAYNMHEPASEHIDSLDVVVSLVLVVIFVASVYYSIKGDKKSLNATVPEDKTKPKWSLLTTIIVLLLAGAGAAFVSDWFVVALEPAMKSLGINEVFAGLVVVALAGNAIENVVGIQLALKNKSDYAVSVILNSSLQIAIGLIPILVLLSFVIGGAILSLVISPLLIIALALTVVITSFIVYDGKSIWLEGLALICLYVIVAAAFWWG